MGSEHKKNTQSPVYGCNRCKRTFGSSNALSQVSYPEYSAESSGTYDVHAGRPFSIERQRLTVDKISRAHAAIGHLGPLLEWLTI
jgi:hypothetical protein